MSDMGVSVAIDNHRVGMVCSFRRYNRFFTSDDAFIVTMRSDQLTGVKSMSWFAKPVGLPLWHTLESPGRLLKPRLLSAESF